MFLYLYPIPVTWRYAGIVFLMLVAAMWEFRYRHAVRAPAWWIALLFVNAVAGVNTFRAESGTYSQARNVAQWLDRSDLKSALLLAYQDPQGTPVAAYLRRSIYGLECQCDFTFVRWNVSRAPLGTAELLRRIRRAIAVAQAHEAILLRSVESPLEVPALPQAPGIAFTLLQRFTGGKAAEQFLVYRITVRDGATRPTDRPPDATGR